MAQGITDSGITWAARVAQAAAVVVAGYNTAAAIKMAEKQEELAKGYLNIAKEQRNYYNEVYAPCEDSEISEACSAELYEMHVDSTVGRMLASVRHQFAGRPEKDVRCIGRYCTGKVAAVIKDLAVAEAQALATATGLGIRYEEQRKEAKDDLRWNRRAQALNRGRDMMSEAVEYSGFAYGLFGRLGAQAAQGAAGAIGYLGYASTRRDTVYPERVPLNRPQERVLGISYPLPSPEIETVPMPQQPAPARPRIRG